MKRFTDWSTLNRFSHNFIVSLIVAVYFALPVSAHADTAEELAAKIHDRNVKILELEKEITAYENTLAEIGTERKTLEGEVQRLDISRKKISADVSVTENKIEAAQLTLEELGGEITDKESRIVNGKGAIVRSIKNLYIVGDRTLIENLMTSDGLREAWLEADKLRQLESTLRSEIVVLNETKQALTENFNEVEDERRKLSVLRRDLSGQKNALDQTRKEQASLLTQTKSKESEYQKLLNEKQRAKLEFEQELQNFEAALQYTLDPTLIPKAGSGALSWPLDSNYMARCKDKQGTYKNAYCISQFFGNTAFARTGAYNGSGHNGIDFGAPQGTKIIAALTGVVEATGNTDLFPGCYSYGKWALVRHSNGLSTLYAHLSVISVSSGDTIPTGGLIGYSGKTGYATGPHLHFSVYASNGVKLVRLGDIKTKTNCANATIPIAPTEAYLDPYQYL